MDYIPIVIDRIFVCVLSYITITCSYIQLRVNECTFGYLLNKTIKITKGHFLTNKLSHKL